MVHHKIYYEKKEKKKKRKKEPFDTPRITFGSAHLRHLKPVTAPFTGCTPEAEIEHTANQRGCKLIEA